MAERDLEPGHALFETALGWVGIGWSASGITHVQLPEKDRQATHARLMARGAPRHEAQPGGFAAGAVEALRAYAGGSHHDLSRIPVDLGGVDAFRRAIYDRLRDTGFGETMTYGSLAEAAGHPGKARETGQAMASNPMPILVPCHRVLAAGGRLGGFSAPGGAATKRRLLAMEHAQPPAPPGQGVLPL